MYSFNDAVRIGGLTPGVVLTTGTTEYGRSVALATTEGNFWYPEEWVAKYRDTPEHDAIRSGVTAELVAA